MEEYLNQSVNEVISKFPAIGDVLNKYGVGCVTCGIGSCLLKDVVEIHDLSPEAEAELMVDMSQVIFPNRKADPPQRRRQSIRTAVKTGGRYSPPIQKLVAEHIVIKRMIALIPAIANQADVSSASDRQTIRKVVNFIRNYADKYHHAKEEEILFKYFDERQAILQTMHADHQKARATVAAVLVALECQDGESIVSGLMAYQALLTEHIRKEDEILYRWMDRNLSPDQVQQLMLEFEAKEAEFGDAPQEYESFVGTLEQQTRLKEWRALSKGLAG